jgi:RNA polymerase sigma factor (sigma-70 family)
VGKLCVNEIDYNFLYEQFYEKLFKIAYYITKDSYLSEDIIQEAFLKAYQKVSTIKDVKKIGSWLSTITKRTAIDMVRKESRSQTLPIEDNLLEILSCKSTTPSIEKEMEVVFLTKEVYEEIKHLKPEQREVIELKVIKGLRDDEIAAVLDINKATVKTRIFRARKNLKDLLLKNTVKNTA